MILEYLKTAAAVVSILANIWIFISMQRINKEKATNDQINAINQNMSTLGTRINTVETKIEGMPTHKDLSEIHEKVNDISDCVNEIKGESTHVVRTLTLIQEHLLNGARK